MPKTAPSVDIDHAEYAWLWEPSSPWTDEQVRLFSNLPLDIVRLVFERAMEDRPRPLHLLRVSRQVCHWLEPLVYEYITLSSERQLDKFYRTFRKRRHSPTKNITFFQRYVRTFFVCAGYPRAEKLIAIVKDLTGLRSLACWDPNWGGTVVSMVLYSSPATCEGADLFPYKLLRRISFSASLLAGLGITFTHRAFRDLTHMDIYFHPAADWESLKPLPNLTHLSLDLVTELPTPSSGELSYWFSRILDACAPTVKVVIFGVVNETNADFDLVDSEGDYLLPGWPPADPGSSALGTEGWAAWVTSESKCPSDVDLDVLHPIAQLAFGRFDPRAVPGSVTNSLPPNQLYRDLLVYFVWPDNGLDWDGTADWHRDSWTVAEDIIEKRKGLTYTKLVSQMS
ncbi:hypothetical protein P691DRAFT_95278 [Macrolepiota fuliginosa MF-IS2]|uniref:Uncharacterized protein n=1 Tax=Macrolepiota fuliginosa MF-IS2 TaxID=1400762 RepID=A0A9P6C3R6_9AGAR|nr:hypothetical protein P691DRAFT_95278 [Macrolepiota fuliginosa MF-IS2]